MPSTTPDLSTVTCGAASRPGGQPRRCSPQQARRCAAAPWRRRFAGASAFRFRPGILERRRRRWFGRFGAGGGRRWRRAKVGREQVRRQGLAGPRRGALALFPRTRREQQIALRLRWRGFGRRRSRWRLRRRQLGRPRRLGGERTISRRLIAAEQVAGLNARCARLQRRPDLRCDGNSSSEPPRDILQFARHHPEAKHDQAGTGSDHAGQNHRIAETEFLDRDAVTQSRQALPTTGRSQRPTTQPSSKLPPGLWAIGPQPPMPRYRHIVRSANREVRCPAKLSGFLRELAREPFDVSSRDRRKCGQISAM